MGLSSEHLAQIDRQLTLQGQSIAGIDRWLRQELSQLSSDPVNDQIFGAFLDQLQERQTPKKAAYSQKYETLKEVCARTRRRIELTADSADIEEENRELDAFLEGEDFDDEDSLQRSRQRAEEASLSPLEGLKKDLKHHHRRLFEHASRYVSDPKPAVEISWDMDIEAVTDPLFEASLAELDFRLETLRKLRRLLDEKTPAQARTLPPDMEALRGAHKALQVLLSQVISITRPDVDRAERIVRSAEELINQRNTAAEHRETELRRQLQGALKRAQEAEDKLGKQDKDIEDAHREMDQIQAAQTQWTQIIPLLIAALQRQRGLSQRDMAFFAALFAQLKEKGPEKASPVIELLMQILQRLTRADELNRRIQELESALEAARSAHQQDIESFHRTLAARDQEISALRYELGLEKGRSAELQGLLDEARVRISELEARCAWLESQLEDARRTHRTAEEESDRSLQSLRQEMQERDIENDDKLREALKDFAEAEEARKSAEDELEALQKALQQAREDLRSAREEIEGLKAQLAAKDKEIAELKLQLEEISDERDAAQSRVDAAETRADDAEKRADAADERAEQAQKDADKKVDARLKKWRKIWKRARQDDKKRHQAELEDERKKLRESEKHHEEDLKSAEDALKKKEGEIGALQEAVRILEGQRQQQVNDRDKEIEELKKSLAQIQSDLDHARQNPRVVKVQVERVRVQKERVGARSHIQHLVEICDLLNFRTDEILAFMDQTLSEEGLHLFLDASRNQSNTCDRNRERVSHINLKRRSDVNGATYRDPARWVRNASKRVQDTPLARKNTLVERLFAAIAKVRHEEALQKDHCQGFVGHIWKKKPTPQKTVLEILTQNMDLYREVVADFEATMRPGRHWSIDRILGLDDAEQTLRDRYLKEPRRLLEIMRMRLDAEDERNRAKVEARRLSS